MNNQEAFTAVVRHARSQKEKCGSHDGIKCWYRGPENTDYKGMKCFIGALIPDNEYEPSWDEDRGVNVDDIYIDVPTLENLNIGLLESLQVIHDICDIKDWEDKFEEIANRFDLTIPK